MATSKYIRWFEEISIDDIPLVGGKNASLGEMYRELTDKGIKIPNGFAITAEAYWHILESAGVFEELKNTLEGLDIVNVSDLAERGKKARNIILDAKIPDDLWNEIKEAYDNYFPALDANYRVEKILKTLKL